MIERITIVTSYWREYGEWKKKNIGTLKWILNKITRYQSVGIGKEWSYSHSHFRFDVDCRSNKNEWAENTSYIPSLRTRSYG